MEALVSAGCQSERCSAFLHERELDESALTLGERALAEGVVKGGSIGGATGALLGTALALGGGLLGVGPLAAVAAATGLLSAYGAALGLIAGSSEAEERLRELQGLVESGKGLIAVEVEDAALEERARTILAEMGGVVIGG